MSLTSQITDPSSAVGSFMKLRCGTGLELRHEAKQQMADACTVMTPGLGRGALMLVGTAFDYRLRYAFAITPPSELVAWRGACILNRDAALGVGPSLPSGLVFAMPDADDGLPGQLLADFFESLQQLTRSASPHSRRPSDEEEAALARHCVVLGLLEQFGRGYGNEFSPLMTNRPDTLADLLELVEGSVVHDMCELARVFYDGHSELARKPFLLNPTFEGSLAVGGADADLIVDGCLLELKVSGNPEIRPEWLKQVLGYVLLDFDDELDIEAVGFYMARQGRLVTWPLDYFLARLTGPDAADVSALRREFQNAVQAP